MKSFDIYLKFVQILYRKICSKCNKMEQMFLYFQYLSITSSPIEGFFIFYKPYHPEEGPFQNVTLLEPSVRAHLLTKLLPSTEYAIRMQSFNSAGKSVLSNQVVERTKGEKDFNLWHAEFKYQQMAF